MKQQNTGLVQTSIMYDPVFVVCRQMTCVYVCVRACVGACMCVSTTSFMFSQAPIQYLKYAIIIIVYLLAVVVEVETLVFVGWVIVHNSFHRGGGIVWVQSFSLLDLLDWVVPQ